MTSEEGILNINLTKKEIEKFNQGMEFLFHLKISLLINIYDRVIKE